MTRKRRRFEAAFKAKVALEAVRGMKTINEVALQFKVHPNQVTLWKKQLLVGAEQAFEGVGSKVAKSDEPDPAELHQSGRTIYANHTSDNRRRTSQCWTGLVENCSGSSR